MVIVFPRRGGRRQLSRWLFGLLGLVCILIFFGICADILRGRTYVEGFADAPAADAVPVASAPQGPVSAEASPELVISAVAADYGVPPGPAFRLSGYLRGLESAGGVGLFAVRQSHLRWIQEALLDGVAVDLEDAIQNAQVAMALLSRWHASGYDWPSCFLIYVYGFPALQKKEQYVPFLSYVFEEGGDE
jgi:hypothetical protein